MANLTRSIMFDEFSSDVEGFFERVLRENETVLVERGAGEVVALKTVRRKGRKRRERTQADREAFLSSAGGWKGLVDTEKLKEDIYESRRMSTRPQVIST